MRWKRWFAGSALLLPLLSVVAPASDAAEDGDAVTATHIAGPLYMLEGAGGNVTASIGPDGVLLIDDGLEEMAPKLAQQIAELGGGSPRMILNTHFHYDHSGGNGYFSGHAVVIATPQVRARLDSIQHLWGVDHPAQPANSLPKITYQGSVAISFNGETVTIRPYAHAHTDGDSVAFFESSRVVSMGDLYFSGMFPIFHPEHDGGIDGMIAAVRAVLDLVPPDARVVPGHGPLATRDDLAAYLEMLESSVRQVRDGLQKGKSLADIQSEGLPKEWEPFSHGFITTPQWIALLYRGLSAGS